nr:MAG TPA: hypothetical protein [Caudoviricetes sp.]
MEQVHGLIFYACYALRARISSAIAATYGGHGTKMVQKWYINVPRQKSRKDRLRVGAGQLTT